MLIYKIVPRDLWAAAEVTGTFAGAPVDRADGYIHFSTGVQVRETAHRHFAGQDNLMLVTAEADSLGPDLRWEPSRNGDLFPHLYAPFAVADALRVTKLPLGPDRKHQFPNGVP